MKTSAWSFGSNTNVRGWIEIKHWDNTGIRIKENIITADPGDTEPQIFKGTRTFKRPKVENAVSE
jgi:hypothetical protein